MRSKKIEKKNTYWFVDYFFRDWLSWSKIHIIA